MYSNLEHILQEANVLIMSAISFACNAQGRYATGRPNVGAEVYLYDFGLGLGWFFYERRFNRIILWVRT